MSPLGTTAYTVRFGYVEGDDLPDTDFQPWTGAHERQRQALVAGGHIRNPTCFTFDYRGLTLIDRPSRIWMAEVTGVRLPIFVSDFTGEYNPDWIEIRNPLDAMKHIEDVPKWGPRFDAQGMRYRAP